MSSSPSTRGCASAAPAEPRSRPRPAWTRTSSSPFASTIGRRSIRRGVERKWRTIIRSAETLTWAALRTVDPSHRPARFALLGRAHEPSQRVRPRRRRHRLLQRPKGQETATPRRSRLFRRRGRDTRRSAARVVGRGSTSDRRRDAAGRYRVDIRHDRRTSSGRTDRPPGPTSQAIMGQLVRRGVRSTRVRTRLRDRRRATKMGPHWGPQCTPICTPIGDPNARHYTTDRQTDTKY